MTHPILDVKNFEEILEINFQFENFIKFHL